MKFKLFIEKLFANFSFDSFLISVLIIKSIIFNVSWITAVILFLLLTDGLVRKIITYLESEKVNTEFRKNVEREIEDLKLKINKVNSEFTLARQNRKF